MRSQILQLTSDWTEPFKTYSQKPFIQTFLKNLQRQKVSLSENGILVGSISRVPIGQTAIPLGHVTVAILIGCAVAHNRRPVQLRLKHYVVV